MVDLRGLGHRNRIVYTTEKQLCSGRFLSSSASQISFLAHLWSKVAVSSNSESRLEARIDHVRMKIICNRKNKSFKHYSELNDHELYCVHHLPEKTFYRHIPDISLLKRASDLWKYKKSTKSIETYADYFQ